MTRVLVAPDSFKGTFSAAEVADAVGRGLEAAGVEADRCPIADGGEGTMAILVAAQDGRTQTLTVSDPLGRPVAAAIGWIDGGATAIVEMALASGLGLVAPGERDAEAASAAGTGEVIAAAVAAGARRIVVSVGGSATTDGGAGAVATVRAAGVPLHAIVGSSELSADEAQALGLASVRLAPTPADMEAAGRALAAGLARAGSGHAATMTEPRSTLGDADAPPPPEQTTEEVERATRAADPRPKPGTSPEGRHPAAHHLGEEGQADE